MGIMSLLPRFQQYIKKQNLFQQQHQLLVAVSGGVDSVVLCELCSQSGFTFAIAHCNFQLREKESDADEAFVKSIAEKYAVAFFVKRFDTASFAKEKKFGIQVAARELRYEWFAEILNPSTKQPFQYLLTAHHANDNLETLLMNFFKGTGIGGLQGILPKSGTSPAMIRPLLFAKKEAILKYATENHLSYREDASNSGNKYTRNYFRNELIPSIREVYPQVEDNLLENINRFTEVNILYRQAISLLKKKMIVEKNGEIPLPVLKLLKTAALQTLLFEITREYNFTPGQTTDIIKLLTADSGKHIDSATHRILRNRAWLIITKLGQIENLHFLIEETDQTLNFSNYRLTIEKLVKPARIDADPAIALLEANTIKFPLLLRKWKQGDYFYPLGMKKKKKLSRFLIDKKISVSEKENTWVVEMDKKIIWVAGHRIDDRFKIGANTQTIMRFKLSPA